MRAIKSLFLAILFIATFIVSPAVYAKSEYHSFVDEMIDNPKLFEEDLTDEFLAEKREINQFLLNIIKLEDFAIKDSATFLYFLNELKKCEKKIEELRIKERLRYSEDYTDWDTISAGIKVAQIALEKYLIYNSEFPYNISGYGRRELEQKLRDENNWKKFYLDIEKLIPDKFRGSFAYSEIIFSLDRHNANLCADILGESDPITLKQQMRLANDYSDLGDSKTALEIGEALLPKVQNIFGEKSKETAEILEMLATDYKTLGNYGKSEESLLKAIEINKILYGEESSPKLLSNISDLIILRRSTLNSDAELYGALDRAAKNLSENDLQKSGYFRAKVWHATKSYVGIIELANFMDDPIKIFKSEYTLGKIPTNNSMSKLFDFEFEISKNFRRYGIPSVALLINSRLNDLSKPYFKNNHHKKIMLMCNLSEDYLSLNQSEEALELAQKALKTSQKIYGDEHPCTIYAIHTLTNVYRRMGLYSKALDLDQQAYKICEKVFVKSSAGEPIEKLTAMGDVVHDYSALKNYEMAAQYYNDSLYNIVEIASILVYLNNDSGKYEDNLKFLATFGNDLEFSSLGLYGCQMVFALGETSVALGKKEEACRLYIKAIEEYEKLRSLNQFLADDDKKKWFEALVPYYKKAAAFLVTQNETMYAFQAVELCKTRLIVDRYNELSAIYQGGLSEEDILTLANYKKQISQYQNKIKEISNKLLKIDMITKQYEMIGRYIGFKDQLIKKYPMYDAFLQKNSFITDQIKPSISPNQCYITFSIVQKDTVNEKILAFVVDENGEVKGVSISVDDKFFDSCNVYRELLAYSNIDSMKRDSKYLWKLPDGGYKIMTTRQSPAPNAILVNNSKDLDDIRQELSAQLGNTLLAPLSNDISSKTNWIISPDGELNNIPFETLQFNGKMAIESANICYVPSLAVLELMKEMGEKNIQLQNRKDIFAMGNAVYGNNDYAESRGLQIEFLEDIKRSSDDYVDLTKLKWANLPGTGEELKNVSALFSADKQEIITDIDASERNLKQRDKSGQLSQYKYLLFATHGLFLPKKPEYSSIVLSQGLVDENYDGYVTIGEWFGYNLNSDLVYLSACESGLGDYQAGEGIIGLPYALTVAGNKDTVMSLWKIDDEAAAKFASVFFGKLKEGETEVQALNETKREFLSDPNPKFNSPSAWAAFLLYGI